MARARGTETPASDSDPLATPIEPARERHASAAPEPTRPAPGTPIIADLQKIERHYQMGDTVVRALDGVDIQVHQGEYVAIMGRSGSGKSTLLNILGCLDRPTAGRYLLGGEDTSKLSDDRLSELRGKQIGFIFQSFNLIQQLTVLENLEVPLFYQDRIGPESRAKAEMLAARVGLDGRLYHRPTELSGGQQQRVAIARALMNDPLFLLADEATGNLDSRTEQEILNLLEELRGEGMTIVSVTHNESVAERAQRTIWLRDGDVERVEERQP
ncbi:MAG: ABC transporter ATP-binding protein [Planctomycetota bacterium]